MEKPASLRAALSKAVPELERDADRLHVFIEDGDVAATAAQGASFQYTYTLCILVTNHAGHPDPLFSTLLKWLSDNEADFLLNPAWCKENVSFEVEFLNNASCDIMIKIKNLTERVREEDGALKHLPEPTYDYR